MSALLIILFLSGTLPGVKKALLRECLAHVHQDIVTCWKEWRSGKRLLVLESLAETTIIHTDPD